MHSFYCTKNAGKDEDSRFASTQSSDGIAASSSSSSSPLILPPCAGASASQSPPPASVDSPSSSSSTTTKRRWPCLLKRQSSVSSSNNNNNNNNNHGSARGGTGTSHCLFSGARIKKRVRISEAAENPKPATPAGSSSSAANTAETASSSCAGAAFMTDEEKMAAWWTAQDFSEVKDEVKRQCKQHRQDQQYSDCLTDAYQSACIVAASAGGSTDDGWGTLLGNGPTGNQMRDALPSFPDERMARQLTDECAPRGLEVYSSRLHALRRQRHLQESKHAVFLEQARQQSHNVRDADLLACQARRASRWARSFATLLGRADAWAAAAAADDDNDGSDPHAVAVAAPPADAATDNSSPSTLNDDMDEAAPCDPSVSR